MEAAARDEIAALLTASREAGLPLQSSQAGGQLVGKKREEEDGGVTWGIGESCRPVLLIVVAQIKCSTHPSSDG